MQTSVVHDLSGGFVFSPSDAGGAGSGIAPAADPEDPKEKQKPRALIVDDSADVTEMLAVFLKHAGYESVMAFSAPEALDELRDRTFDIIVSDIGMPGMNGYELAEAVRSNPDYQAVPMIAVTGFSQYGDKDRALESGFNAHMAKPINPLALLKLIESLRS